MMNPFRHLFSRDSLGCWALVVVGLTELLWSLDYHEERWRTTLPEVAQGESGDGLVIQCNGLGYYAWLRSLLIDGDWSFDNEFDEHNPLHYYVPLPRYRTPLGRRANQWSVGPACAWALTVVPGHLGLRATEGWLSPWAADGYSLPYQLLVGGTSLLIAFLGLGFLYAICRTQARPARAGLATALLTLGTTIVYFNAIEISLPHGMGTAVLAGLVWYWLRTFGSSRPRRWFLVGILVGAAALMRWQLAAFALLPAGEAILSARRQGPRYAALASLAGCGALLAFTPQMIAWRCVYGAWLVNPIQGVSYHWLQPSLCAVLFSQDRSLFYWTPLTMIALGGAVGAATPWERFSSAKSQVNNVPREPCQLLLAAFIVQVLVLAGMWGKGEWLPNTGNFAGVYLARSYGFRDLTESLAALAPGLAWLLERASPLRFRLLAGLGFLLVVWNLLLLSVYTNGLIDADAGANPGILLTQAGQLIRNDPFVLLQVLQGPILVGLPLAGSIKEYSPSV